MNRQEIIETYELPTIYQLDEFKEGFRAINTLVANKDRAYERLVKGNGKVNRRSTAKSKGTGFESTPENGTES